MKSQLAVALMLFNILVAAVQSLPAWAEPGKSATVKEYETWVRDTFIDDRQKEYDRMKKTVEQNISSWDDGKDAKYLRGAPIFTTMMTAVMDSLELKLLRFPQCNDGRILSWKKFFDKPDVIPFMCLINATGNDKKTGRELNLLCRVDRRACGIHFDNRHPGIGGVVGLGIMAILPSPKPLLCSRLYITGSYVEYFFPWFLVNASRQMYQSSYLADIYVQAVRPLSRMMVQMIARMMVMPNIGLVQIATQREMMTYGFQLASHAGISFFSPYVNMAISALSKVDEKFMDLAPHGSRGYARNFSSIIDIEFMSDKFKHVPHYSKDTHRFGSELPFVKLPVPIPGARSPKGNIGGILQSKFLNTNAGVKSEKMKEKFKKFLIEKGPRVCMRHNKFTKKTPKDLDIRQKAEEDKDLLCLNKLTNRYPLTSHSFSPHDTDFYWRMFGMGGIDLFYTLNFPEHYDDGPWPYTIADEEFHSYIEQIDRLAITRAASDTDFVSEAKQCKVYQTQLDYAAQIKHYKKSNIHDPTWGAQNTSYVFGLVKGVWNFKGIPPLMVLPNGLSRYPSIYVRFN